ncbi:MAG: FeoC-like transcriptional regulator [Candidatus Bathyarchaeota archaeon]|nr:FeoC-like transcriptional regulator [Candidatus Bathyarchaeota archaeon]
MIKQVLRAINTTGVISEKEIAEAAKTSPELVQQAIAVLQAKGYLTSISLNPTCGQASCASCGHCKPAAQTSKYAYVLTEKGKAYLQTP